MYPNEPGAANPRVTLRHGQQAPRSHGCVLGPAAGHFPAPRASSPCAAASPSLRGGCGVGSVLLRGC